MEDGTKKTFIPEDFDFEAFQKGRGKWGQIFIDDILFFQACFTLKMSIMKI